MKRTFLLIIFMFIGMCLISAQNLQTVDVDASANIIESMTITKVTDLKFGNISKPSQDGTVVMSLNGIRTPSGVILPSITGDVSAAQFIVTGFEDSSYSLTIPSTILILNGSDQMLIDDIIHNSNGILVNGEDIFSISGTLHINANQPVGLYQGSFPVSVDYQ